MNKNMRTRVCIIGVGPSGITALKNAVDLKLEVIAYDINDQVGGNWIYSEDLSHSSVFETTHIISSRLLSQYEDYTWEDHNRNTGAIVSNYPSHSELKFYFQSYADYFGLTKFIQFETKVNNCSLVDEVWHIEIEHNGQVKTEKFTHLVVCNGHHWNSRMSDYPGMDSYKGNIIHSHAYKKSESFKDKSVLVIGGGNSACDVAVETSRVAKNVDISWRRGYRILPKMFFGMPSDMVMSQFVKFKLPLSIRAKLADLTVRIITGPNKNYGLPEPKISVVGSHPTINDELLYRINHGKIRPRPDISKFEKDKVVFNDGQSSYYDFVIACTGYIITHPFFEKSFIDYSEGKVPLFLKMMHGQIKNLYFIGLFQPLGCIWPGSELQSKIMAREIAGIWKRPENIRQLIQNEIENPHYNQIDTPRHTITVDFHKFRSQLLKYLPKNFRSKIPVST